MTEAKLRKLCRQWQRILRLSDWEIDVEFKDDLGHPETKGGCCLSPKFQEAEIDVKRGMDDKEVELTLVHELIHVRFPNHKVDDTTLYGYEFEVGIEMMARALTEAYS